MTCHTSPDVSEMEREYLAALRELFAAEADELALATAHQIAQDRKMAASAAMQRALSTLRRAVASEVQR